MRRPVKFEPVAEPIREPVTKLGGQPVWLAEPQWPVSAALGEPMSFLGQFRLSGEGEPARLAYLFMAEGEDAEDTWESEAGENALIIQPDGRVPGFVKTTAQAEGPTALAQDHRVADDVVEDGQPWEFLGDEPVWVQNDETPGPGWRLVAQLSDAYGFNFGDMGIGYAFVSDDDREGRFLWQCS